MGKQGARGALFRLTLLAYGYTFVGKGTVAEFQPDLYHEAGVYNKLRRGSTSLSSWGRWTFDISTALITSIFGCVSCMCCFFRGAAIA